MHIYGVISDRPSGSVMLKLLVWFFSQAKQKVFQWKAPTAPGSSTECLFVNVLTGAQTRTCDCTRRGSAEMSADDSANRFAVMLGSLIKIPQALTFASQRLGLGFRLGRNFFFQLD